MQRDESYVMVRRCLSCMISALPAGDGRREKGFFKVLPGRRKYKGYNRSIK